MTVSADDRPAGDQRQEVLRGVVHAVGLDPSLLAACIHCGYCLPACPTYALWSDETDSPRGRILLMRSLDSARIALDSDVVRHFDRCLGCLACMSACPSGVEYGRLIEQTRSVVAARSRRSLSGRLVRGLMFRVFPYPGRLRILAAGLVLVAPVRDAAERIGITRRLPRRVATFLRLAPTVRPGQLAMAAPRHLAPAGSRRYRVGLFTGCVQRVFHGGVNAATARVLAAEGCEVLAPDEQGCCGALDVHTGRPEEARRRARAVIAAFEPLEVERIIVNAAGCGSTLKEYGHLLAADPAWAERALSFSAMVRDVSEWMAGMGVPRAPRGKVSARVVYQDACHLLHAQGIGQEPREMLAWIPGLELVEIADAGSCCGSGGVYNLLEDRAAAEIGRRKAIVIDRARPDYVLSPNPGCRIQLEASARAIGARWPVVHPIEIVDASIQADGQGPGENGWAGRPTSSSSGSRTARGSSR